MRKLVGIKQSGGPIEFLRPLIVHLKYKSVSDEIYSKNAVRYMYENGKPDIIFLPLPNDELYCIIPLNDTNSKKYESGVDLRGRTDIRQPTLSEIEE